MNDKQHGFVAAYIGEAERNATEAARIAGYKKPGQQGHRLLKNVEIQKAVGEWRAEVKTESITDLSYRLARYADLERRYVMLIEARADDIGSEAPGGESGLLVRQRKMLGGGEHGYEISEYVADPAVTKELRETLKQAAQDSGQWTDKYDQSGKIAVTVRVEYADSDK